MSIRGAAETDIQALGAIAEQSGLFPADYLPDMIAPALDGGDDVWLVAEQDGGAPGGFAFARREALADNVWNILAIGVAPEARRKGHASALLRAMESRLGARLIIIETTQLEDQAAARALYEREGYAHEGRVRDFFALGEDKVIFRKALS